MGADKIGLSNIAGNAHLTKIAVNDIGTRFQVSPKKKPLPTSG
jgi:hypothetical protein